MHRQPEAWALMKPSAVVDGSRAQSINVLGMAADDIAELAAALKPFAELADQLAREAIVSPTDATCGLLTVSYADLRNAARVLREHNPSQSIRAR